MSELETYTEQEAALIVFKGHPEDQALRAMKRLRLDDKVRCIKSGNTVSYAKQHLMELIGGTKWKNTQSETSGSVREKDAKHGTSHGTTAKPDKRALSLVAQKTFGKQKRK